MGPVLGFIPRSVWPTKPVLAAGYEVLQEYYGMPASVHSSVAVTPYGDLYRRGGVAVVIAGMLVLACSSPRSTLEMAGHRETVPDSSSSRCSSSLRS